MTAAIVVLVVGLGSYLFRMSMVVLAGTERLWIRRATPFVVPAAFAALATGGIVTAVGGQPLGGMLPPLAAAAVAVAVVRRTGVPWHAIATGMPTLWLLSGLVGH